MTADQLRALRDANPFRPFTIRLADGQTHTVPHRDFVSQSPGGRIAIVYRPDDSFSIIDLYLVTELVVSAPADGGAAPGASSSS
jgi:hypothetical protein